jgi:hypothetical protein
LEKTLGVVVRQPDYTFFLKHTLGFPQRRRGNELIGSRRRQLCRLLY